MKNINNTSDNFPTNFAQYFDNKPEGMSYKQYFFSIINPNRFQYRVMAFIYFIIGLCKIDGWTMARIPTLALMRGISTRTTQRLLRKLVAIEILEERIVGNHKRYRVNQANWDLLRGKYKGKDIIKDFYDEQITQDYYTENWDVTPDVTPEFTVNVFESVNYEVKNEPTLRDYNNINRSYDHVDDLSDPKIPESDKTEESFQLDPIEIEIKQEFEVITGKPLNLKKNRKSLTELKEMAKEAKDIVMLAFSNVANHIAETGAKVYNLAYVLTAAKNLMCPKASPKTTPKDYAPASEQDKAYASIGGNSKPNSQEPITPQQAKELEQTRKLRQACEENPNLRSELYNNLDQEDKEQLIQEEIECLKTKPVWQTLERDLLSMNPDFLIHYAMERIKQYLLLEHLDYQEFLAIQPSS